MIELRKNLVRGLPMLKYDKDHLCPSCQLDFFRTKDETPQVIEKFIVKTQRALNATVRFVRTDNGMEFVNKTLDGWFESVGISHETSVPRSPQQNGVVERHRTLMEVARTILMNCESSIVPKKPNLQYFRVFGSLCYPTNDYDDVGKLKAKADIGIFVGYAPTKKAYGVVKFIYQ
ncbi:retrovirus-related pol polyprotein from transposon TNT 1-94 [Tanacetum coccineum]